MFDNMWIKVPGLVNTLNNEGEMDNMLGNTEEDINFTSILVPTLTWDLETNKEILTSVGGTWVDDSFGIMSREGIKYIIFLIPMFHKY